MQYAVRGELFLKAGELQAQGKEIIFTNVGNPHQLGCKPLTFTRQVRLLLPLPLSAHIGFRELGCKHE
jgi:glutamate--glyoxylate aminotransferase